MVGTILVFVLFFFVRSLRFTLHTILVVTLVWSGSLCALCFIIKNTLAALLFLKVFIIVAALVLLSLPHLSLSFVLLRLSARYLLGSSALVGIILLFAFAATLVLLLPVSATLVSIYHYREPTVESSLSDVSGWNIFFITLLVLFAVAVFFVLRYLVHFAAAHIFTRLLNFGRQRQHGAVGEDSGADSVSSAETSSLIDKDQHVSAPTDVDEDDGDKDGTAESATMWSALSATFGGGSRIVGAAALFMLPNSLMQHIYHRLALCSEKTFRPLYVERARAYSVFGVARAAAREHAGRRSLHAASVEAWRIFEAANVCCSWRCKFSISLSVPYPVRCPLVPCQRTELPEHSVVASVLLLCSLTLAVAIGALVHVIYTALLAYRNLESVGTWCVVVLILSSAPHPIHAIEIAAATTTAQFHWMH